MLWYPAYYEFQSRHQATFLVLPSSLDFNVAVTFPLLEARNEIAGT